VKGKEERGKIKGKWNIIGRIIKRRCGKGEFCRGAGLDIWFWTKKKKSGYRTV
jgi:hypothetical protein